MSVYILIYIHIKLYVSVNKYWHHVTCVNRGDKKLASTCTIGLCKLKQIHNTPEHAEETT